MNFLDFFGQSGLNFRDCFQIIWAKFLVLFSNCSDKIFRTAFRQSRIGLKFGFDPKTDVFGFCGVFWYHNNSVMNREGTKRCLVVYGSEILVILYVIVGKINNMLLYVKFMLICSYVIH